MFWCFSVISGSCLFCTISVIGLEYSNFCCLRVLVTPREDRVDVNSMTALKKYRATKGWETALEWLRTLSPEEVLENSDVDNWLELNDNELPEEFKLIPRAEIYAKLKAELVTLRLGRQLEFLKLEPQKEVLCLQNEEFPCEQNEELPCEENEEFPCEQNEEGTCEQSEEYPSDQNDQDPCEQIDEDPLEQNEDDLCEQNEEDPCEQNEDDPCEQNEDDPCEQNEDDPCEQNEEDPSELKDPSNRNEEGLYVLREESSEQNEEVPCEQTEEFLCEQKGASGHIEEVPGQSEDASEQNEDRSEQNEDASGQKEEAFELKEDASEQKQEASEQIEEHFDQKEESSERIKEASGQKEEPSCQKEEPSGQNEAPIGNQGETSAGPSKRTRRNGKPITEKWRPVYVWLEGLNQRDVVKASEITEWLAAHPEVRQRLHQSHTIEHVFNYIQKCHSRMLVDPRERSNNVKAEKKRKDRLEEHHFLPERRVKRAHKKVLEQVRPRAQASLVRQCCKRKRSGLGHSEAPGAKATRLARSELHPTTSLVPLEKGRQGARETTGIKLSNSTDVYLKMDRKLALRRFELLSELHKELVKIRENFKEVSAEKMTRPEHFADASPQSQPGISGTKLRNPVATYAWCFSEALAGVTEAPNQVTSSIIQCLSDREHGGNSASVAFRPQDVGKHGRRWTSFVAGWNSLASQFQGPVNLLQKQDYSTWSASWCAYTSSVAIAPVGLIDQGVQKVLDLRLHPGGLPQLVCSCNAAPNELLLYNLVNGRARELSGHNCQIQAVEYALNGDRIISCGTNVLKVWDSSSGTCLYTLGPIENGGSSGHKKKISAMSVQQSQSCLVATSGGEGESEILLWNVRTGELASDLNAELRQSSASLPSMDALKFCHHNLLICGSDSAGSQPALIQIWDVDAVKDLMTFPASDSYITCLNTNPGGSIIITGSGDGSVGLYDLRTGGAISRLPLGVKCEATSVAFSACGTYFHSSSTGNNTLVWDTRMMPMEPGLMPRERPVAVSKLNSRSNRPLHCLSHGSPMPTTQNAGQLPGHVDEGDGGVNDARWFQNAPVLVTASGNGSVALWDVSLGQPCLRLLSSHTRCINTVAVASDDQLICSGGDDQKVVLYHNSNHGSMHGWRLTHPLSEDLQSSVRSE